jgi:hypothetical protein
MVYVKYKTINSNCAIQTLKQYQIALNNRFGKNKIKAITYEGMKVKAKHCLLNFNNAIAFSTPHRLLHYITKNPETILGKDFLGFKPSSHYRRKTLRQYQKELDAKYGKNIIKALNYISYNTDVEHFVKSTGKLLKEKPNKLLWSYASGNTFINGGKKYFSLNPNDFHVKLSKISDNKVVCLHDYKGSNKPHKLKCLDCTSTWILKRTPLYKDTLKCPNCNHHNRYSEKGLKFLNLMKRRYKLNLRHAKSNNGEKTLSLPKYSLLRVDGFSFKYKIVFEFYGDVFHGNLKTLKASSRNHPYRDETNKQLYKNTLDREKALVKAGYTVVSIWESEFQDSYLLDKFLKRTDNVMRKILWDKNLNL